MDLKQGVIELTENPAVLDRLRKLKRLQKDSKSGKEFVFAQFNAQSFAFYVGEPRTLPLEVAEGLQRDNHTVSTEKCISCKGLGNTSAGICLNCKGKKETLADEVYRILKVTRVYDPMLVDPDKDMPTAEVEAKPKAVTVAS